MKALNPSRRITRIAFGVIIVFVLAQVIWWIIFQNSYISNVTEAKRLDWESDALVATRQLSLGSGLVVGELLELYPHLSYNAELKQFEISRETWQAFEAEQRGFVRMFAYEGPFFVLVVLTGLYIIARSLRAERELKRRQQNFLSAVTHEFKTPISTLRLLVQTVRMRKLSPDKEQDYLHKMEAELSRLEQTSEQVLASARLEASNEPPVLEAAELNRLVKTSLQSLRPGLEARGARLEVRYSPEPLAVSLNADVFAVILTNLLDNAIKYSPDTVKSIAIKLEAKNDLAIVHVEDKGVGISEEEKAHIFDAFYRVGNEMTRESKGVGLGLNLVKRSTEAMNGWVRVSANSPKGTRFSLVFPRRVASKTRKVKSMSTNKAL